MLSNLKKILVVVALAVICFILGSNLSYSQVRPANVKDVENPDKQTIHNAPNMVVVLMDDERSDSSCSAPVPTGKRWVVEQVSAEAFMMEGQFPRVRLYSAGTNMVHLLPMIYQGGLFPFGYNHVWNGNQAMKFRLDAGSTLCVSLHRANGSTGQVQLTLHTSGYLVDVP